MIKIKIIENFPTQSTMDVSAKKKQCSKNVSNSYSAFPRKYLCE